MNELSSPLVSVLVPCRNEKDHIEACVRSILAQHPPPGGFDIIVADGDSDDETRDILTSLATKDPRLKIVDNPGRIVSTGINTALRVARGRIIVRMDAHTEYAPDYISQCVRVLEQTQADNVGGPMRTRAGGYRQAAVGAAYHSRFALGGGRFHDVKYEGTLDTVPYGCWPREVFDRIGNFDEELVRNQDDEFNLRIIRNGGKIWQSPKIKSWYRPRASLGSLFWQYAQYGYWKVRVIQKHRRPAAVRHLVPGLFVLSLIALPVLALSWPAALWGWLGIVSAYAVAVVVASFLSAAAHGWRLLPVMPLVFACCHIAYGGGFLLGIGNFLVVRPARRIAGFQ